jgi:hypothetical protein
MEEEINKSKVWLGEDGIIRIEIDKFLTMEDMKIVLEEFYKIRTSLTTKPKVSISVTMAPIFPKAVYRRETAEIMKDAFNKTRFEKVALWGMKEIFKRTIASFIITASGLKNIKFFGTEEEALKWLKEE